MKKNFIVAMMVFVFFIITFEGCELKWAANQKATLPFKAVKIAEGAGFSLVVMGDGTLWAAGRNNYGQLGLGDNKNRNAFVMVPGVTGVSTTAAGYDHS